MERKLSDMMCRSFIKEYDEPGDIARMFLADFFKGINSFNVDKGSKLSTYVSRCIDNEILMHLRNLGSLVLYLFFQHLIINMF